MLDIIWHASTFGPLRFQLPRTHEGVSNMPEYVYALHDFLPENEDEISFRAGEPIEVIEKDDQFGDGWWQVSSSPFLSCCAWSRGWFYENGCHACPASSLASLDLCSIRLITSLGSESRGQSWLVSPKLHYTSSAEFCCL